MKKNDTITAQFDCPGCNLNTKLKIEDPGFLKASTATWSCKWCESDMQSYVRRIGTASNPRLKVSTKITRTSEKLTAIKMEEAQIKRDESLEPNPAP